VSVIVVAIIVPKPEYLEEVALGFERVVARVHAEDEGCELYALNELDGKLVVVEKWQSAELLAAHGQSPVMREWGPQLEGKLAQPTEVMRGTARPAGTVAQGQL
jgi:quinol monooxygenase YgiN